MKREERFAYDIAELCCNPVGNIKIGEISESLLNIIVHQTQKREKFRQEVFDWIVAMVEQGLYSWEIFGRDRDKEEIIKMVKEDYDKVFYKK